MSRISIMLGNEAVGSVAFTPPESELLAVRTASGFRVQIPALVTFSPPSESGAPLLLEGLRAVFSAADGDGHQIEIGVACYSIPLRTSIQDLPITLS